MLNSYNFPKKYTVHVEYRTKMANYSDLPVGQLDVWDLSRGSGDAASELIRRRNLSGYGIVRAWVTDHSGKSIAQFFKGPVGRTVDGGYWVTQRY